ncbi:immunity 8 family protein [Nonomuraea sp. NPDC050783]|uniref:immunity 8 family protein n=1 Tax=Nonomuraea sp. NPDC050783 TaxID=3154634 RepID=UPI003465AF3E
MKAAIRYLHTPDIDPGTYVPDDPQRFMFLVQMIAGPDDGPGDESFDFTVCTPQWLQDQVERDDRPISGAHHVIVSTYDWAAIESFFDRLVNQCTGATWSEVTTKLSRYGHYEFADYIPTL